MQAPTKKTLPGFSADSVSVLLKLNKDVISHFRSAHASGHVPKLVVKNGAYSIRISETVEFPCSAVPEYSNLDIFHHTSAGFRFDGRVKNKLTAITDPRQVQQYRKTASVAPAKTPEKPPKNQASAPNPSSLSSPASPLNFDPYLTRPADPPADVLLKFLSFMALGPSTAQNIAKHTSIPEPQLKDLTAKYCQLADSFMLDDTFPNHVSVSEPHHLILKDRAYKDLRPWDWRYYSDAERTLIITNVHRALTRLGFSDTHPLRKRIVDQAAAAPKKPVALGGGLLVSKKISPFKKSHTESPKLVPTDPRDAKASGSPLKKSFPAAAKKRNLSSSSSGSDDEAKRFKLTKDEYTSPSSVNDDDDDEPDKRTPTMNNLAIKFKLKYKEYAKLYESVRSTRLTNPADIRKALTKLFELHQHLSELKNKVWKLNDDTRAKTDIMTLNKHKKVPTPPAPPRPASAAGSKPASASKLQKKKILNY